jgi:hypothetical protein
MEYLMSTFTPSHDDMLTERQASELTKLSIKTLKRHALRGTEIGRRRVGGRILYVRSLLVQWIQSSHSSTQQPSAT